MRSVYDYEITTKDLEDLEKVADMLGYLCSIVEDKEEKGKDISFIDSKIYNRAESIVYDIEYMLDLIKENVGIF